MKLHIPPHRKGSGRDYGMATLLAGLCWLLAMTSMPAAGQTQAQAPGETAQPGSKYE